MIASHPMSQPAMQPPAAVKHSAPFVITPVVLCGGSGSRLWPLSRKSFPKQFVSLIGKDSLLQLTFERLRELGETSLSKLVCVAADEHRFLINDAMQAAGVSSTLILEPKPRNTAAAMALAALRAAPDELMLFCPSDHYIPDAVAFGDMVQRGCQAARAGAIVTFGVIPSFASTGYGYIERGAMNTDGDSYAVSRFIEKPNKEVAQTLIATGNVLWNAGIFLCQAKTLVAALEEHAPGIFAACRRACDAAIQTNNVVLPDAAAFNTCPSESIDIAVMQKCAQIAVVPFDSSWSDVGSWNSVADLIKPDTRGNRIDGMGLTIDARNTYIHAPNRTVVALGTEDLLIIDTADAILIAAKTHVEEVRDVVAELESRKAPQSINHRKVSRPWGWYDQIDAGEGFQVKRIHINAGGILSLQTHQHRSEHWTIVSGSAEVTVGEKTFILQKNQSTYIPAGVVHRLHNRSEQMLEIIEVQVGSYLGEDDIVRLEDVYGRETT